jgi:Zn-finger nucleic acid-binding protein
MANCPRCQTALVNNQVDEFLVRLCVPCKGMLLPHADVIKILERSWHAVKPEDAEKMEFRAPATPRKAQPPRCPDCQTTMDEYGYMGMAAIPIDRCDRCSLLWLDADELQNMVLALAKTNYRSDQARLREWGAIKEEFVSTGMQGQASRSWVFGGSRGLDAGSVVADTLLGLLLG